MTLAFAIWNGVRLEKSHLDWFNKISDAPTTITRTASTATDVNIFDLKTVIKASQAISSEIVLEKLLKKLLHIILENAGARLYSFRTRRVLVC